MKTISQRVITRIANRLDLEEYEVKPQHTLKHDLNCDSLDHFDIMLEMEEEFGIELNQDRFTTLTTVQQVINYVADICTIEVPAPEPDTTSLAHKVAVLKKASLDLAMEVDRTKNELPIEQEKRNTIQSMVERVHAAIGALDDAALAGAV